MSRRNRQQHQQNSTSSKEFSEVINKIKNLKHWSDYDIYDISKLNGDAFIVADTLKKGVESTQIRKFYNEVLNGYYALFHPTKKDITTARTVLAMLTPRAHYARKRKTISQEFLEFLTASTDLQKFQTNDLDNFKRNYERFVQFFEAVVGYHKYLSRK